MGGGEENKNENNFLVATDTHGWDIIQPIHFLEGKQKLRKVKYYNQDYNDTK